MLDDIRFAEHVCEFIVDVSRETGDQRQCENPATRLVNGVKACVGCRDQLVAMNDPDLIDSDESL